jgi:16S rRNA (adenine1518-N6/adenine1519-N6)-dimethyltransferase
MMKKSEIRMILQQIGVVPRKTRGQNFLASDKIAGQVVEAAELHAGDFVIEIGPGLGMITEKILKTGASVIAVEIDEKLAVYLQQRFGKRGNFRIITDDFLYLSPETIQSYNGAKEYTFITNPPYRGAKQMLKRILTMDRIKTIVITLQHEVAQEALTPPGSKNATALSYFVHCRFLPEKLFDIPRNFFYPEPAVASQTLLLTRSSRPRLQDGPFFYKAVELLMHARKRQLKNVMRATYHLSNDFSLELLASLGLTPTSRPNELTTEQMVKLTRGIKSALTS